MSTTTIVMRTLTPRQRGTRRFLQNKLAVFGIVTIVLFLLFGLRDQFAIGIPLFVVLAVAGASFFLWASVARTDPSKSAYDYLAERGR